MANKEIKKLFMEDGRRGEEHVTYRYVDENGCHAERTVEMWAEEARPLRLEKKVKERTKPYIYEREVETIDPVTGEVVDSYVESTEPQINMQRVSHIKKYDEMGRTVVSPQMLKAQSHDMSEPEKDCLSKEEAAEMMADAVRVGISAYHKKATTHKQQPQINAQSIMRQRMASKDDLDMWDYGMMAMIVGQIAFLAYFFM